MGLLLERERGEIAAGAVSEFLRARRLARVQLEILGERIQTDLAFAPLLLLRV